MRNWIRTWRLELALGLLVFGLMLASPHEVRAECEWTNDAHLHEGADHCDTGGTGCSMLVCG